MFAWLPFHKRKDDALSEGGSPLPDTKVKSNLPPFPSAPEHFDVPADTSVKSDPPASPGSREQLDAPADTKVKSYAPLSPGSPDPFDVPADSTVEFYAPLSPKSPQHFDAAADSTVTPISTSRKRKFEDEVMDDVAQQLYFANPRLNGEEPTEDLENVTESSPPDSVLEDEGHAFVGPDGPVHFIRGFKEIDHKRQMLQYIRIQVKEERQSMKLARRNFLKAAAEVQKSASSFGHGDQGDLPPLPNPLEDLSRSLRELEEIEVPYEDLEDKLIPAEYELQELEEDLYGNMRVDKPPEQIDRISDYPTSVHSKDLSLNAQTVRGRLFALESEYADLVAEQGRRAEVGATLDDYEQDLLDSYPRRRGQLWAELADVEEQHARRSITVEAMDGALADIGSQFDNFDTRRFPSQLVETRPGIHPLRGGSGQDKQSDDATIFQSQTEHFQERSNILTPISDRLLDPVVEDFFPNVSFGLQDLKDDFWFDFVGNWLSKCVQSPGLSASAAYLSFEQPFATPPAPHCKVLRSFPSSRTPTAHFPSAYPQGDGFNSLGSTKLPSMYQPFEESKISTLL